MISAKNTIHTAHLDQNLSHSQVLAPITYPKAGTHMLYNILRHLDIPYKVFYKHIPMLLDQHPNESLKTIFSQKKFVVVVRDPRDQLISSFRFMCKKRGFEKSKHGPRMQSYFQWRKASTQEKLDGVFQSLGKHTNPWFNIHHKGYIQSSKTLALLKRLKLPNVLILKFEDLIGPKGNPKGAASDQYQVFETLCKFAGVIRTQQEIKAAIDSFYGNSSTFVSGDYKKVGQWKSYFQSHHTEKANELFKKCLEAYDYEI